MRSDRCKRADDRGRIPLTPLSARAEDRKREKERRGGGNYDRLLEKGQQKRVKVDHRYSGEEWSQANMASRQTAVVGPHGEEENTDTLAQRWQKATGRRREASLQVIGPVRCGATWHARASSDRIVRLWRLRGGRTRPP